MAVDNTKKNYAFMEFPLSMSRQDGFPLDRSSVFYALEDAESYAKSDPTAYVGQVISVIVGGVSTAYQIKNAQGELEKLGDNTPIDVVTAESLEDGKVVVASTGDGGDRKIKTIDKRGEDLVTAGVELRNGEVVLGGGGYGVTTTGIKSESLLQMKANTRPIEGKMPVFSDGGDCVNSEFDADTVVLKEDSMFFADEVPVFEGNTLVPSGVLLGSLEEKDTELDAKITKEISDREKADSEIRGLLDKIPGKDSIVTSADDFTADNIIIATGDGKEVKDSGFTIGKSVPPDAKFTDTVYTHPKSAAGAKAEGLYKIATDATGHVTAATTVTKEDITDLGVPGSDTVYTHPTSKAGAKTAGLYKITTDATGHVTGAEEVTKEDIVALGIPGSAGGGGSVPENVVTATGALGSLKLIIGNTGAHDVCASRIDINSVVTGDPSEDSPGCFLPMFDTSGTSICKTNIHYEQVALLDGTVSDNTFQRNVTAGHVLIMGDGKQNVKDSGFTIETSVPANAQFLSPAVLGVLMGDKAGVSLADGAQVGTSTDSDAAALAFVGTVDYDSTMVGIDKAAIKINITADASDVVNEIPITSFANEEKTVFRAVLQNIKTSNYNRVFTATPVITADGADCECKGVSRSVFEICAAQLTEGGLDSAIKATLNKYVNTVGVRFGWSSGNIVEGSNITYYHYGKEYTSDAEKPTFFDISSEDNGDGSYKITVTPRGEAEIDADMFLDTFRINNNNSTAKKGVTEVTATADKGLTFVLTPANMTN